MRQSLKEYIFESKSRVKNQDAPVFSVTNDKGFIPSSDCFDKVVHSKDIANYKVVIPNFICYNPSRINVGSIALNTTNQVCAVSPMYTVFGCDTKKLLPKYLLLFLKSAAGLKTINSKTLGTVRFQLKFDSLKNIDLRIPNIQEQRRIIAVLKEIDDLRQKQRKAIKLTRQMIPALFYESIKDKSYTLKKLGDICSFEYGLTATAQKRGDTRFVRITDIQGNGLLSSDDQKFIDLESKNSKFLLRNGDILVARTGATYGKTLFFDKDDPSVFASYLIRIHFNTKEILPCFYWIFSQTDKYWNQARSLVVGTGQPQLNANAVKSIQIPTPSLETQQNVTTKLQEIIALIDQQEQSLQKLDVLFDSVLNQFFSHSSL